MACLPCLGQRAPRAQSSAEPWALQPNYVARVWATEASDERHPRRWPLPVTASSKSRAGGERTSRALRAGAASLGSLKTPARPAVGQGTVRLGAGGRPPRALRSTWFVLAGGTPPGGTWQGWCADGEFVKFGRAVGAGPRARAADGLACGWSLPPAMPADAFQPKLPASMGCG